MAFNLTDHWHLFPSTEPLLFSSSLGGQIPAQYYSEASVLRLIETIAEFKMALGQFLSEHIWMQCKHFDLQKMYLL